MPNEKRPISQKKLEANRRNAQKATGPASARGRAISSQNARKYQLLPFENPALPAQITAQYYGYFIPTSPRERRLVNTMVQSTRICRYFRSLEARGNPSARKEIHRGTFTFEAPKRGASVTPYELLVAECAYSSANRELEAIRSKAA